MRYTLVSQHVGAPEAPAAIIEITLEELFACRNSNGVKGFSHWKCERLIRSKFEELMTAQS